MHHANPQKIFQVSCNHYFYTSVYMDLSDYLNILYSETADENSLQEANRWLTQWQYSSESIFQIFDILDSCIDQKLVTFSLITIKNKIKYSKLNIETDLICEVIFNLVNKTENKQIHNLAMNCLAGIFNISESSSTINILNNLPLEDFYALAIDYMDYYDRKVWRPNDRYVQATLLYGEILNIFNEKLIELGFASESEMNVIIEMAKSTPDDYIDNVLQYISFIKQGFYENSQITPKIAEYINAVASIKDEDGSFTSAIIEMTHELVSALTETEETIARDNGIMELLLNSFLMNSPSLNESDLIRDFCNFSLNLAAQIPFSNENWPLLIENAVSFVSDYLETFDQDVPRFLFELAVTAVNEGVPHTEIKCLFQTIFHLCENDLTLITERELSVGVVTAASYIGPQFIPLSLVESLCEEIYQSERFQESILFINEIGYQTKENVSEMLEVLLQVFEEDISGASHALLKLARRNRGKLDSSVSAFFDALQLDGSFNKYIIPALINLMCSEGFSEDHMLLIVEYLQAVLSEAMESGLAQLENVLDALEISISLVAEDFKKLTPEVKELIRAGYSQLADDFSGILLSPSNSIQIYLSHIIECALRSGIAEPRQEYVEWIELFVSRDLFLLSHIPILKYISELIPPGMMSEFFESGNWDDDEAAKILSDMSKFGDNVWNVFGSTIVCRGLESKGILFKYTLKVLKTINTSKIPAEFAQQFVDILSHKIEEGNIDEAYLEQAEDLIAKFHIK